jgi:hypothetical protein
MPVPHNSQATPERIANEAAISKALTATPVRRIARGRREGGAEGVTDSSRIVIVVFLAR